MRAIGRARGVLPPLSAPLLAWLGALVLAGCGAAASSAPPAPPTPGWHAARSLPGARFEAYAATVGAQIFYLGGITGVPGDQTSARESDRVDVYDPAADAWRSGPSLPAGAARHHLAVAVDGGRVYLLGGFTGIIGGADVAGRFLPNGQTWVLEGGVDGAWRRLADQPLVRGAATAQALGGRLLVVGGGSDEKGAFADLLVYDPATDRWTPGPPMPTAREHLASCAIGGRMLVVGGWSGDDRVTLAATESYDPASGRWSTLAPMPTQRGGLGAAAIGEVCQVVGGERWDRGLPGTFAVVERFDPARGAWSPAPAMPTARHGIGVAAIGGQLYVVGGGPTMGNSYTDVVEVLAP